jgi:hypothetical protein
MISSVLSSTAAASVARTRAIEPISQGKPELTSEEKAELQRLKQRDAEVRKHEQAHAAAGGSHAGAPNFEYERGPDGKMYAVGGHVSIDVSAVEGDPKRTLAKMEQVQRAANAPAEPSAQDKRVAASAAAKAAEARRELAKEEGGQEGAAEVGRRRGMQAYARATAGDAPSSSMSIVACGTCGTGHEGGH